MAKAVSTWDLKRRTPCSRVQAAEDAVQPVELAGQVLAHLAVRQKRRCHRKILLPRNLPLIAFRGRTMLAAVVLCCPPAGSLVQDDERVEQKAVRYAWRVRPPGFLPPLLRLLAYPRQCLGLANGQASKETSQLPTPTVNIKK